MTVESLDARRWANSDGKPESHKPRDALAEALRKIDAGELEAEHVIICFGKIDETGCDWSMFQGGSFDGFAQSGLLHKIAYHLGEE